MVSKEGSRFFFYSASQTLSIGGANNFYFLACGSCEGWFLVTPRFKDQNLASGRSFPQKVDVLFPVGWLVGSARGVPLLTKKNIQNRASSSQNNIIIQVIAVFENWRPIIPAYQGRESTN